MTTFSGEAFLCGHGRKGAPLILQNVTSVHFANTYISDVDPTGGTNIYGMHLLGNASTITGKLLFETYSSILFQGSLISSDLNITWGGVLATSSPALALDRAFSSGIINSNLVVDLQANTSRPILSTTDGNEVSACSYYIQRSSITGRALGAPVLYIPLNVASNSSSLDISIIGANANPTQPAFSAYYAADAANVTGDGTVFSLNGYTCVALTNANNSFNTSNGKFSAPQNGNYTFEASLMFYGVGAAHTDAQLFLQAGGVSYQLQRDNPYPTSVGTTATFSGSITIPMLATQEAYLTLVVGGGAKTISIGNGATLFNSRFSGGRVY
jgi:hypothetical protein